MVLSTTGNLQFMCNQKNNKKEAFNNADTSKEVTATNHSRSIDTITANAKIEHHKTNQPNHTNNKLPLLPLDAALTGGFKWRKMR